MANSAPGSAGRVANVGGAASAGSSGAAGRPQVAGGGKPPRKKPNFLTVKGGRREMKGYTVTGAELWTLGLVQGGSAISFALAGSAFGFWISTRQAIDLAANDTALGAKRAAWEAYGNVGFYGAIALAVLGVVLFGISGFHAWKIAKATIHD